MPELSKPTPTWQVPFGLRIGEADGVREAQAGVERRMVPKQQQRPVLRGEAQRLLQQAVALVAELAS